MSLFVIGDLHLSLSVNKPMDVFGGEWEGYVDKIISGFEKVQADDTVVLLGDLSWAMNFGQAVKDFAFMEKLPGKKIIVKGNHDYWWQTAKKINEFFDENCFTSFSIMHNNAFLYENIALCGTRGWFYEEDKLHGTGGKVYNREVMRLEASLKAGRELGAERIFAFLHYPPIYGEYRYEEITGLFEKYGVERCYYGHLHSHSRKRAVEGMVDGVEYRLVSGDHIGFEPVLVI